MPRMRRRGCPPTGTSSFVACAAWGPTSATAIHGLPTSRCTRSARSAKTAHSTTRGGRPAFDPTFWGLTLRVADATARAVVRPLAYEPVPAAQTLVSLVGVGDDESRSAGFTLRRPMDVRVYAIGEAVNDQMVDYAWIVDATNHRRVWTMHYQDTERAGGRGAQESRVRGDDPASGGRLRAALHVRRLALLRRLERRCPRRSRQLGHHGVPAEPLAAAARPRSRKGGSASRHAAATQRYSAAALSRRPAASKARAIASCSSVCVM